jgi:hypothetical protein
MRVAAESTAVNAALAVAHPQGRREPSEAAEGGSRVAVQLSRCGLSLMSENSRSYK